MIDEPAIGPGRRMVKLIDHDVVQRFRCESLQVPDPARRLDRREQNIGIRLFLFAGVQTQPSLRSDAAKGVHRLSQNLLAKREPLHPLEPGQRKGIQNQRVTLVEGDPVQVAVIQRIFHEFVDLGYSEYKIAEGLNADGILSPSGRRWGAGSVLGRLQNETYLEAGDRRGSWSSLSREFISQAPSEDVAAGAAGVAGLVTSSLARFERPMTLTGSYRTDRRVNQEATVETGRLFSSKRVNSQRVLPTSRTGRVSPAPATAYPHITLDTDGTVRIDETRYEVLHLVAEHYHHG